MPRFMWPFECNFQYKRSTSYDLMRNHWYQCCMSIIILWNHENIHFIHMLQLVLMLSICKEQDIPFRMSPRQICSSCFGKMFQKWIKWVDLVGRMQSQYSDQLHGMTKLAYLTIARVENIIVNKNRINMQNSEANELTCEIWHLELNSLGWMWSKYIHQVGLLNVNWPCLESNRNVMNLNTLSDIHQGFNTTQWGFIHL